jgi:competence protein ComGC
MIKKRLKNNKGFTVVELLLSMSLAVILTTFMLSFVYHESIMIVDMEMTTSAKVVGDNAMSYIKDSLINCKTIKLYDSSSTVSTGADQKVLYITNGKLYDSNIPVSGGLGDKYSVSFSVSLDNVANEYSITKPIVTVNVEVRNSRDQLQYKTSESFENVTMSSRGSLFGASNYSGSNTLGSEIKNPRVVYTVTTQYNVFYD